MKFIIATSHSAYMSPFLGDGREALEELSQSNRALSLASLDWLKPAGDYNYNADLLLNEEIEGLNNVGTSLNYYFKEQFLDSEARLLWIPSFYLNYLYYKDYLNKSIFDADNILSELVKSGNVSELEVIVFHLGSPSLDKLSYADPKSIDEKVAKNIKISGHEVSEGGALFDTLMKNYSLSVYSAENPHRINWEYLHESSASVFSKYGKLLNLNDETSL